MTIKAKAAVARDRPTEPPKLSFPAIVIGLAERRIAPARPEPKSRSLACSGVTGRDEFL
jgi:hypothetical protein